MTREQLIILGVIAAAFVAGWLVHAVTGRRTGDDEGQRDEPDLESRLERAHERTLSEVGRAIDGYHETTLGLLRGGGAKAPEPAPAPQWRPVEPPGRRRDGGPGALREPERPRPVDGNAEPAAGPAAEPRRPLADEVRAELERDVANESMVSFLFAGDGGRLGEEELDLADWGFTYGVAWRRARERWPKASEAVIADEALRAAETVFREYTNGAGWSRGAPGVRE